MKVMIGNYKYGNYLERKRTIFKGSNLIRAHWQMPYEDFKLDLTGTDYGNDKAVSINWSHNDGIDAKITLFVKDEVVDQMNYVLVWKDSVAIPVAGSVDLSSGAIPYFITGYQYMRKDQYMFSLIRDVVTENIEDMFKKDNKFLIKRELFDSSSDLYYQREDNFIIPMRKTSDLPLFDIDPYIVMFMSKPEGLNKSIMNIDTVNEYIGTATYDYDTFISNYGNGSDPVYSVEDRNMTFGRTFNYVDYTPPKDDEWESVALYDAKLDMAILNITGITTTDYNKNERFMLKSPQNDVLVPRKIYGSFNRQNTDNTWKQLDFMSFMQNWKLVGGYSGVTSPPIPVSGIYTKEDTQRTFKITVTPTKHSFIDLDAAVATASGKPTKHSKYTKWSEIREWEYMSGSWSTNGYGLEQAAEINWNRSFYTTYNIVIEEMIEGYVANINLIPIVTPGANAVIYTFPYNNYTAQYVADVQNNRDLDYSELVDDNPVIKQFAPEAIYDVVILPFNPGVQGEEVGSIIVGSKTWKIKTVPNIIGEMTRNFILPSQTKVESIGNSYEITTSDYTARMTLPVFENKGFMKMDLRWQLIPNQVRYNILPHYKEYNGANYSDDRGLWCDAIPLGLISDAWVEYVRSNKNYLATFDVGIKKSQQDYKDNLTMYDMNAISGIIGGSAQGAANGAMMGGPQGAVVGAIGGAAAGAIDYAGSRYFMERQFNRNIDYAKTMFSFSNATTKSRPDQIIKTIGLSLLDKIVPRLISSIAPANQFAKVESYFKRFGYTANYINNLKRYETVGVGEYPLKMQLLEKDLSWSLTNREFLTLDQELDQGFIYVKE